MKKLIVVLLLAFCLLGAAGKAYFDNIYLNSYADFGTPTTTPATSAAGTSRIYYDNTIHGLRVTSNADATSPAPQLMNGRNKIINGNFNIWQRGTALVTYATGSVGYLADKWTTSTGTTGSIDVSQTTNITGINGAYNGVLIQPHTTNTAGAGSYALYYQGIEGYNLIPLNNQVCTLSFWAKGTAGTYSIFFQSSNNTANYVIDWVVPDTNLHQYVYTFTHSNAVGSGWNYTNGLGMYMGFAFICGSLSQMTTGSWQAVSSKFGSSAMTNTFTNSTSNSMTISQVQLETGPTATQFEQLDYSTELTRCKRYYNRMNFPNSGGPIASGLLYQSTRIIGNPQTMVVPMRTTPTLTISALTDFDILPTVAGTVSNPTSSNGLSINNLTWYLDFQWAGTGATAGQDALIRSASVNCYVDLSADF